MKNLTSVLTGSVLLFGVSSATAQVVTTSADTTKIYGSDTLNQVMDDLLDALAPSLASGGIASYGGIGSSGGERQMEGSPSSTEPSCTPTDGNGAPEANPGCQEIAPMSRAMAAAICEDDTASANAEGLAICKDGLIMLTDNDSLGEYGDDAAACNAFAGLADTNNAGTPLSFQDHGVGNLRDGGLTLPVSGYVVGATGAGLLPAGAGWRDVPRVIYTGCKNNEGNCNTVDTRVARCDHAVRRELVSNWSNMFEGVDCGAAGDSCTDGTPDGGLRFAFRRDNVSGTTIVFLNLLGLAESTSQTVGTGNLLNRGSVVSFVPGTGVTATPLPNRNIFCDGGQIEGFFPTGFAAGTGAPTYSLGDPIRKPCADEDDLCGPDGRLGLVRPVISTDAGVNGYPDYQCGAAWEYVQFINTSLRVCPDGSAPVSGACPAYFYQSGAFKTFDCLNDKGSAASVVPAGTDGRAYNYVQHAQNGTVSYLVAGTLPVVAQWRMNMAELNAGFLPPIPANPFQPQNGFPFNTTTLGDHVCIEDDATRNIGCFVGQTTCTLGFAGREAAYSAANNDTDFNEPVQLKDKGPSDANILDGSYVFARDLYVNALNGFENLTADCRARHGIAPTDPTPAFCLDEKLIASSFYNMGAVGNPVADICTDAGFIPIRPAGPGTPIAAICRGAATAATCGAPVTQALTECEPDGATAAP